MMLSPESYEKFYLKGKTKEQLLTKIRGLKQEIGRLKNRMEHPDYGNYLVVQPNEDTRLKMTRAYLERAKKAYREAGGEYVLSQAEQQALDFNRRLEDISCVKFTIGGFHQGHKRYIIDLSEGMHVTVEFWDEAQSVQLFHPVTERPLTREGFLATLLDLRIGEWRSNYSPRRFGHMIMDGTQWELEIDYVNHPKSFYSAGSNSYPYNFDKWEKVFGIKESSVGEV